MDATGRNETFVSNIGPPGNPRGYTSIASKTKSMCAEIQYIAAWDESMYVCMYVCMYPGIQYVQLTMGYSPTLHPARSIIKRIQSKTCMTEDYQSPVNEPVLLLESC